MPDPRVTIALDRAAAGDRQAAAQLLPLVYEQLRAAAHLAMRGERAAHTLSATALVHEVYIKLVGPHHDAAFASRAHFYAAAAQAMRQVLIDHARAKLAQKRGGPGEDHPGDAARQSHPANPGSRRESAPMSELRDLAGLALDADPEEILSLDAAVSRLEGQDPQAAAVVRLRFYAGLSIEHTAIALGISPATVKRDWQFARAWLFKQLNVAPPKEPR